MSAIGGSIENIAIDGREFPVAADADVSRKLGGRENEIQMNGDGTARIIKTPAAWSLDGLVVQINDARDDQEYLQSIADGNTLATVAVTYASGEVYQGQGTIVSDLAGSNQSATASVSMAGTGKLVRQ